MTTSPVQSITDELLAELEQKAKAANEQGDWYIGDNIAVFPEFPEDEDFVVTASPATILALVEHIRSLTDRLENAEKDAARYRWLRRRVGVLSDGYSTIWLPSSRTQIDANDEAETGSAIDAAIAQEGHSHE